jgi:2-dehydro-3-deoxygluconokinase
MNKIFCFGELLLRLSPALQQEWIKQQTMPVFVGGAELNVAKALATWGMPVGYSTALPDNYISKEILDSLNAQGIQTNAVQMTGERIGMYILPMGADLKNAGVIYDRNYSSFASLQPGQLNWEQILEGYDWFHFSAISPALNENIAKVCEEGLQAATKKGMTISVDLNYRAKLWQYGKRPVEVMPALVKYCHVVMGNIWSARDLLGTVLPDNINEVFDKDLLSAQAKTTATNIMESYPACKVVANTYRFSENDAVRYYATITTSTSHQISKEHFTETVVDKVGSGDCFMAGLIYGLTHQKTDGWMEDKIINFAASAAFGKLQEKGDSTLQNLTIIQSRF